MSVNLQEGKPAGGFWSYLKEKELSYFPTGALRWWILILLILAWTVQQFEMYKMGPVLYFVLEEFQIDLTGWGWVAAGGGVAYCVASFLLAGLADKYGRRALMIWPLLLYVPVAIGVALAPSLKIMAIFFIFGGALVSGMDPAVKAASRDITPQMGRAMVFAWISLAYTIGALLSNWVASWTIPIWPGWRPQYIIAAVFSGVIVLILIAFFRDLSMKVRGQVVKNQMDALSAAVSAAGFTSMEEAHRAGPGSLKTGASGRFPRR